MEGEIDPNFISWLDEKAAFHEDESFISEDPISIPHQFTLIQDIEISAFFAATFSWGNRTTIIKSCRSLLRLMDDAPYDFIVNHQEKDRIKLEYFVHRTFNATDLVVFIDFLQKHYSQHQTLESAFTHSFDQNSINTRSALEYFYHYFFSQNNYPERSRKHVASPRKQSACKRLNMFLRWMVRSSAKGVDFGLWKSIKTSQLVCPLDVHVARVAKKLGLLNSKTLNWKAAESLTNQLRMCDANDPVKYDFALFGIGIDEKK
jgi:uncharacterized protein (TIGR02757 family)